MAQKDPITNRSNTLVQPTREQLRNVKSEKNEMGQSVVTHSTDSKADPLLSQAPVQQEWADERHRYLRERGWVCLGLNDRGTATWKDPKSPDNPRGTLNEGCRLPIRDGGEEIIRQWEWPPTNWSWGTEEALLIQKHREWAGETLEQTIARREVELAELKAQVRRKQQEPLEV